MLKIGNLETKYRAIPAPMASFTDVAYRKLIDELGCTAYMVTEMISAEGLRRKQHRTLQMLESFDYQTPQIVQLFGSDPDAILEAAKYIENETNYSGIDINMGCPAPKVLRKGAGAALLLEPEKVAAIVRLLKTNLRLPVTVKIRLGFDEVNVFDIAHILDSEGADAIAVHFRTKADRYRGQAKWEYAPQLRETINTVFIGNGDIVTAEQAREKLDGTVDAIMIGRGAIRNPLLFSEISEADMGEIDFRWTINRLIELIDEFYPEHLRLPRVKSFARFLFFGRAGCKKIRTEVYRAKTFEEARHILNTMDLGQILVPELPGGLF